MASPANIEAYWRAFLAETGRDGATRYIECFHFDLTAESATELLALVLAGKKRATCSALPCFLMRDERVPQPGDLSIVTDFAGNPRCVIETTAATILPFRDVPFDLARREGEDDDLASWRRGHTKFFTADGRREGYAFSPNMPVVFEDFRVVYPPLYADSTDHSGR